MPTSAHLVTFVVASIILIEIPGPSLLFALGRALTVGRREAIWSVIGNGLGVGGQIVAVALGLGALVATSSAAFTVLKVIGATYVVWLGIQAIRHRTDARLNLESARSGLAKGAWDALRTGAVVGVTNPKTAVFIVAFFPQFVAAGHPTAPQILMLGVIFVVLAVVSDICWVLAASRAKRWFARRPQRLDAMSAAGGTMMISLGAVMVTAEA